MSMSSNAESISSSNFSKSSSSSIYSVSKVSLISFRTSIYCFCISFCSLSFTSSYQLSKSAIKFLNPSPISEKSLSFSIQDLIAFSLADSKSILVSIS